MKRFLTLTLLWSAAQSSLAAPVWPDLSGQWLGQNAAGTQLELKVVKDGAGKMMAQGRLTERQGSAPVTVSAPLNLASDRLKLDFGTVAQVGYRLDCEPLKAGLSCALSVTRGEGQMLNERVRRIELRQTTL